MMTIPEMQHHILTLCEFEGKEDQEEWDRDQGNRQTVVAAEEFHDLFYL